MQLASMPGRLHVAPIRGLGPKQAAGSSGARQHQPSLVQRRRGPQLQAPRASAGRAGFATFRSTPGSGSSSPYTSFRPACNGSGATTPSTTAAAPPPASHDDAAEQQQQQQPSAMGPSSLARPPAKKPRLPALDSLRFFLIAYIAVGHFVAFATSNPFALRLLTQVNVWVGAFFVLSGYVAGYTATELNKYEAGPRVKPPGAYTVSRVAGYYPLYLMVQLLFGAMFAWVDLKYNGPLATVGHALMTATLTQAWFPAHAEVWNAPTWFLSALTFAMAALPHLLPSVSAMRKKGLRALLVSLTAVSLVAKVAYSYDLGVWSILEGVTAARAHPNLLLWNVTRFHPFYALLEVLVGVAAARLVMVDAIDDDGAPLPPQQAAPVARSAALPALGLLGVTAARAAGWLPLNDPLTRCLLFVPLFTTLVMRLHRNTLAGGKGLAGFLSHPALVYLGTISFPIFVVHGALGQVFYKKVIAVKLWGGVMPPSFFPAYCAIVLATSVALQHLFLENKKVQQISGSITKRLTSLVV